MGLKLWWVLALAGVCGLAGNAHPVALGNPQQSTNPAASDSPDKQSPTAPKTPPPKTEPDQSGAKTPPKKSTGRPAAKKPGASRTTAAKRKRRPISPRVRRIRQAFVASTTLRPMAQQLIQDRTPAAYAGVEAYARAHAKEDAGALAWLVVGYAHVLDHDCAKAIDPLNRAKPLAGDLGDYVAYYLGTCYLQTGHQAEGLATLANFSAIYPDSLLVRDAHLGYATGLLTEGRASEAAELLQKDRLPPRSDIELELGKAFAASGQAAKASEAFANIYYNMPISADADAAYAEMKRLSISSQPTAAQQKTRADLLIKARRYSDAGDQYRELLNHASAAERPAFVLALADVLHRSGRNRDAKIELAALSGATPDQLAQRLYILGEIAWASDENNEFYRTVDELRQSAPTSAWLES